MSPRTPEQNREIRKQTRRQIREAAFTLFAQKGFSNTSVSSIAKEAGVSKGLIYHYFDSKDHILEAIFDNLAKYGSRAMDFPPDLSSSEKLEYMLEIFFRYIRESTEIIRLMFSLALQPDAVRKVKPSIERFNDRQLATLSDLLAELGYENPETEAYYLIAKLDGISLGYIMLGEEDYHFDEMKQKIMSEYVSKS